MRLEQITEGEIRETLQRAQEIAEQRPVMGQAEHESFPRAAEEVGIPREATLQALRERRLIPDHPLAPDDPVFAPTGDGNLYPAEVLSVDAASISVRFLAGGVQAFAPDDLVSASLLPGRKVQYKSGSSWVPAHVRRCEPAAGAVWVFSAWRQAELKLTLSHLRLTPQTNARTPQANAFLWELGLICGGGGTLLGIFLDHLLR